MRGKVQHVTCPAHPAKLTGYWSKVHQTFIKRTGVIIGVNTCIYVVIVPTIANPLSDHEKKTGLIMPTHV